MIEYSLKMFQYMLLYEELVNWNVSNTEWNMKFNAYKHFYDGVRKG